MSEVIYLLIGLIVGTAIAFFLARLLGDRASRLKEIENRIEAQEKISERLERLLREESAQSRTEASISAKHLREELITGIQSFRDSLLSQMNIATETQVKYLVDIASRTEQRLESVRNIVEERLRLIQEDNTKKLDQMRQVVDEKLHSTLEQKLGDSFKQVSERLEMVHRGLGEVQGLATGVGDLKKVLSNVKTRGILGEIQLGNILEEILIPEQYVKNFQAKKGSSEKVEFAVKLPGNENAVYLPIDSKFPSEPYSFLQDAYESGDHAQVERAIKALEDSIKKSARDIRDKYIDPPNTTDFGIMFLPFEGLYAEVVRRSNLIETLQKDYKVMVAGPTTLAAFLNSLHMGFRTLAIEKRSSEVWALLGAVKTEFEKFKGILEKTQKKLQEASNSIEDAAKKTRTIEKKLEDVQEIPSETPSLLE